MPIPPENVAKLHQTALQQQKMVQQRKAAGRSRPSGSSVRRTTNSENVRAPRPTLKPIPKVRRALPQARPMVQPRARRSSPGGPTPHRPVRPRRPGDPA